MRDGLPGGVAADESTALRFARAELVEVVSAIPGKAAYRVSLVGGDVLEERIDARVL